ncbi:Cof-type HAD-IIB family hydrolase [Enterococcus faecalis]
MIKAVFFDIDGTLVTKNAHALASTKEAIKQLHQQGIVCGIATGRGPVRLNQQVDEMNFDVFVSYNGQFVYTCEKEVLRSESFKPEVLQEIVAFSDTFRRQTMFGSATRVEGSSLMQAGQRKWVKQLMRFFPQRIPVAWIKKFLSAIQRNDCRYEELSILKEPIFQCVMLSPVAETEELRAFFPKCHLTRSNPYTVDIIPKGGSKIVGIQACLEHYQLTLEELMVFGDSWNDYEMIQQAGIGVAMGNADPELQAVADYITDTNEKDGIFKALRYYRLI